MKESLIRPDPEVFFTGQKMDGLLNFYGVVKDDHTATVEGAVVIVLASFAGGVEKLLGATFTDRQGAYSICIPKPPDYNGLLGFKVRAGKAYILPEEFDSPGVLIKQSERIPYEEYNFEQDEMIDDIEDDKTLTGLEEKQASDTDAMQAAGEIQSAETGVEAVDEIKDVDITFAGLEEGHFAEPEPDEAGESIEYVTDEVTITQEEKGLAVSLDPVDYGLLLPVVVVPIVQTDTVTDIGTDSVIFHGSIKDTSWEHCDQRKFRVRVRDSESWTDAGEETGLFGTESFSFIFTGLIPGVTYEYKAMAHNLAGWGEGVVKTFTTATSQETSLDMTVAKVEGSPVRGKKETITQKNPYDMYRLTYWRWLDNKMYESRKKTKK